MSADPRDRIYTISRDATDGSQLGSIPIHPRQASLSWLSLSSRDTDGRPAGESTSSSRSLLVFGAVKRESIE
jgi:hypothetical protein